MSGVEAVLQALRDSGCSPKRSGNGWKSLCPSHDDHEPSLSIGIGNDGRVLLKCHAGCETRVVLAALGLRFKDLNAHDTSAAFSSPARTAGSSTKRKGNRSGTRVFATAKEAVAYLESHHGPRSRLWKYRNAVGRPTGMVLRWDKDEGKFFKPVSRVPGGWAIKGMDIPRPLYRLKELVASSPSTPVFVVEGEKAADAAIMLGLLATTSPHGSNAAAKADWSYLSGRHIVLLPDHDAAGHRYAAEVCELALAAGAASIKILDLSKIWADLPKGGDIADLVELWSGELEPLRAEVEAAVKATTAVEPTPIDGTPKITRLAEVKAENVQWLWPNRFAIGKLTLVAGDPGLGKSFLTLDMAARVSSGLPWPDSQERRQRSGGVVLLSAEDGLADTIRPRLDAAGANVERVVALEAVQSRDRSGKSGTRGFDLTRDLGALEQAVRSVTDCRLVVIDPITAYLGKIDSHKNAEIRAVLAPLAALAASHGVAVVAVTHLNKAAGGAAIYRTMGSLAFAAAARSAWAVTKDPQDKERRLLLPIKNNVSRDAGGLAYRVVDDGQDGRALVRWEPGVVELDVDEALGGQVNERVGGPLQEATDWLRDVLVDGPQPAAELKHRAKIDGIAQRMLDRAKKELGVQATREGFGSAGRWMWSMPNNALPPLLHVAHKAGGGAQCDSAA